MSDLHTIRTKTRTAGEVVHFLLPSQVQCLALMESHGMLPHIRDHSLLVTEVAGFLGQVLLAAGFELNLPLIEAGALLHDLGKTPCLGPAA